MNESLVKLKLKFMSRPNTVATQYFWIKPSSFDRTFDRWNVSFIAPIIEIWWLLDIQSIKSIGEYHDLYLKTNVLLLIDIFETFRKTATEEYDHYIILPIYSWDCMLYKPKVKLEQLIDPTILPTRNTRWYISYLT
jgi:hypothetical protein